MQLILPPADDANTYVDLATAETYYHEILHGSTWQGLRVDEKNAWLRYATSELDALTWVGDKTAGTGPLMWPRSFVYSRVTNEAFPANDIPTFLEQATARLAFYRAENSKDYKDQVLQKVKVGSIEIEYDEDEGFEEPQFPLDVKALITDYSPDSSVNGGLVLRA